MGPTPEPRRQPVTHGTIMRPRTFPAVPPAPLAAVPPAPPERRGDTLPAAVAAAWGMGLRADVAVLPTSGFSGSTVYRVDVTGQRFVLKSFASGTAPARAAWVHRLVRHLSAAGIDEVPALTPARGGDTIVTDAEGRMWELARFVAGQPDEAPGEARAAAALESLARIHLAAARLDGAAPGRVDPPAVARRRSQSAALAETSWAARRMACAPSARAGDEPMLRRWDAAIAIGDAHGAAAALAAAAAFPAVRLPVQPVLRDVWSDHVLFDATGRVAGIVDLHAAGVDTPATDLARLLGSWWTSGTLDAPPAAAADGVTPVSAAIDAYERVRPLDPAERWLIGWLDAAGVVCGLDNWFRWTLEEGRRFADPQAVFARVDLLLARLPRALGVLGRR